MNTHFMKRIFTIWFCASLFCSCNNGELNKAQSDKIAQLKMELDSMKKNAVQDSFNTPGRIATFLTFQKENAEEAMNFYVELFDNSQIIEVKRWGKKESGKEGTVMHATFVLDGTLFMSSDSPPIHEWGFTPAVSNFIDCKDENEIDRLFSSLSENGQVMMPLNNYGFSKKFGFVEDQFGVSWQLNLQ